MAYRCITFERREAVGLVTLDRPARANAIDRIMLAELSAVCDAVEADETVAALVVTGAGGVFSSGFDLKEQAEAPPQGVAAWRAVLRDDFDTVMRFWHLSKPTVAAVRGPALAGGCELALACDVTVAAEDARFGEPELRFGAGIVVMLLPLLAGPKHAKEILLSGEDEIGARRAYEIGLINRVVPAGDEVETALSLARRMAAVEPALLKRTKATINRMYRMMGFDEALEMALDQDLLIEAEGTASQARVPRDRTHPGFACRHRVARFQVLSRTSSAEEIAGSPTATLAVRRAARR